MFKHFLNQHTGLRVAIRGGAVILAMLAIIFTINFMFGLAGAPW